MQVEDGGKDGIAGAGRREDYPEVDAYLTELEREVHLIPLGILIRPEWAVCESEQDARELVDLAVDKGDMMLAAGFAVEAAWFLGVGEFLREWQATGRAS